MWEHSQHSLCVLLQAAGPADGIAVCSFKPYSWGVWRLSRPGGILHPNISL